MEVAGIKFAPLNVPLERRLQTFTAFCFMLFLVTGGILGWVIWFALIYYSEWLRYPMLLYGAWILYDKDAGELGGRRWPWVRNWTCWKYYRDYFPAKLIKIADLSPEKNYLLACFPHGVLCTGAFCAFGNDYGGFSQLFPGVESHILTLAQHFITPFIREFSLSIGSLPASATCMKYILTSFKGKALALMVGGAQEAFFTKPGQYQIYLLKRKGFVRIALQTGTSLVPVITFNEPELYDQITKPEGSWFKKTQEFVKNMTGIAPVIFVGRGIFQYSYGIVPHRKPLYVVVGKPIDVDKVEAPTQEQVDELHAKFIESLNNLFESEKHKYIENADKIHLIIK